MPEDGDFSPESPCRRFGRSSCRILWPERPPFQPWIFVPERAPVDDAVGGRESAVEVGGHAVRDDLGVGGEARALAPRAAAEAPAAVPPGE